MVLLLSVSVQQRERGDVRKPTDVNFIARVKSVCREYLVSWLPNAWTVVFFSVPRVCVYVYVCLAVCVGLVDGWTQL